MAGEEANASKIYMLGTLAAEKLLDLVALAVLVVTLLPFMALPSWLAGRVAPLVIMALALAAGAVGLSGGQRLWLPVANRLLRVLPPPVAAVWQRRLAAGLDGLAALTTPSAAFAVWGWTLVAWCLATATNMALFLAFGLTAKVVPALFLLGVMQAGIAAPLPSAPGKIGTFHYLCILALSVFSITGPVALGYALILHLVVIGASGLWAAIALWQRSWTGAKDRGWGLGVRVSWGFERKDSRFEHPASSFELLASSFKLSVSGFRLFVDWRKIKCATFACGGIWWWLWRWWDWR